MITVPLAAVTAAYVVWVFLPVRREIAQLREEVASRRDTIASQTLTATSLAAGKQESQRIGTYVTERRQRMVAEKDVAAVFARIQSVAETAGVRTTRFDPQPAVTYETFRCLPVSIGCSGSFTQLYALLRGLEGVPVGMWISSVRVDGGGQFGEDAGCELTLEIFVNNPDISDYVKRTDRPI
jgi:Tfp pilus assembly protein PilO